MNGNISGIVAEWCHVLNSNDRDQVRHLQSGIQRKIGLAKADYTKSFENSFDSKSAES